MSNINELKADIGKLPSGELFQLVQWLLAQDWESWGEAFEADAPAGRPESLGCEALEENVQETGT